MCGCCCGILECVRLCAPEFRRDNYTIHMRSHAARWRLCGSTFVKMQQNAHTHTRTVHPLFSCQFSMQRCSTVLNLAVPSRSRSSSIAHCRHRIASMCCVLCNIITLQLAAAHRTFALCTNVHTHTHVRLDDSNVAAGTIRPLCHPALSSHLPSSRCVSRCVVRAECDQE